MNPAKQLDGAKTLFAQLFAKGGQALKIKVEQVGRHHMINARLFQRV